MDENVIFTKQGSPQPQQQRSVQQPVFASIPPQEGAAKTPFLQGVPPNPPPKLPSSGATPPFPQPPTSLPQRGVFKIAGIVIGVILFVFLIIRFILPLFGGKQENQNITLTYWGLFEEKQVMQPLIDEFQRQYPNITIHYVRKDVKQYRKSLVTQLENGTGPDIFRYHNSWVGMMRSYLSPMTTEVISSDEFKNAYYPVIQKDLTSNGALYGIPLGIDTLALFVNTELFQAGGNSVPRTWEEFIRVAKDRVVKDNNGKIRTAGAALGTFDNITHAPDIVALLMAQNGTNFSDFSSTVDNASQALEFYTAFAQGEGSVWDSTLDPSIVAFSKGNLAMYFGFSWDIFTIKALNPELQFSVHPVPNLPGRKMAIASYWVEGVSAKSKYQKEAMLFMRYLAKKETLQKLYSETAKVRLFGEPYPRRDLAKTLSNNPLISPFMEQAEYATSSYFASDTYDEGINDQMNAYLGNAVRATSNNTSAQSAVETLAKGVNQVLTKYGR